MDKEFIAIELLHKVGSGGVTTNSIALVLEAFDAVVAEATKPAPVAKKAAPVEAPIVVDVAPSA